MARQPTLYEVLRVAPDASHEELRRAYLVQAREHHPDRHRASGDGAAAAAEDRMRRINQAWEVLGDPLRRRNYDRGLLESDRPFAQGGSGPPAQSRVATPSDSFTPLRPDTPEDPDEDDAWRFRPDEGDPATVPPRLLLASPPIALALGVGLLVVSLVTGLRALVAAGLVCMFAAALLFVGAPVVALFRSQMSEERARRRR